MPGNIERWRALEAAKRRLVYALKRLGLPLGGQAGGCGAGLAFDFLADAGPDQPVMTGHDDGLITINIAEANSAERERRRVELGEPYRTLLGHLRHEVGHYYWDVLVRDGGKIEASRAVFGDESVDYQEALDRHYQTGAPAGWEENFVSAYATMHPWEDFAETWTHYLHMVDTLDTAASFGLAVDPGVSDDPTLEAEIGFDPYRARELRPAGRGLAAADRGGEQPQPQHGPAGPLSVRADARRRSRSCASSTSWCTAGRDVRDCRPWPEVAFTANLRRHREAPVAEAEGATVREVLDRVLRRGPAAALLHPRRAGAAAAARQRLRRRADGRRPAAA